MFVSQVQVIFYYYADWWQQQFFILLPQEETYVAPINYTAFRLTDTDEQRLLRSLMTNYEKSVRPVLKACNPIELKIGLTLNQMDVVRILLTIYLIYYHILLYYCCTVGYLCGFIRSTHTPTETVQNRYNLIWDCYYFICVGNNLQHNFFAVLVQFWLWWARAFVTHNLLWM